MKWTRRHSFAVMGAMAIGIVVVAYLVVGPRWAYTNDVDDPRLDDHRELISRHARDTGLPTELVAAVVLAESGGDARAVSKTNARGLMQIMPIAEREVLRETGMAKGDLFDPDYNIRVGTAYLKRMVDRFDGDLYLALAGYQMGPTRLDKLRKKYPKMSSKSLIDTHAPRSTAAYCRKILAGQSPHL